LAARALRVGLERANTDESEHQRNKSENPQKRAFPSARTGRPAHFNVAHDFLDKFRTRPATP
jgi:hypothetical protein